MFNKCLATASVAAITGGFVATLIESGSVPVAILVAGALVTLAACIILACLYVTEKITTEIRKANRPADDAYVLGYDQGYDQGWKDARKNDRPVAVTFLQRTAEESVQRIDLHAVETV